jgi:hypothetical protein
VVQSTPIFASEYIETEELVLWTVRRGELQGARANGYPEATRERVLQAEQASWMYEEHGHF